MSNDLISRSAVIAIIRKEIERTESFAEHDTQINIMNEVETLPAAYDVDKVVERFVCESINCHIMTDRAVEIVKSGGVE